MRDTLSEFIIIHPYSNKEYIQPTLRDLGCEVFNVLDTKELDRVNAITFNLSKVDTLKYNSIYPEITYIPQFIFIQHEPIIKNMNIGERVSRNEIGNKDIELETKMSLVICNQNTSYWESSTSVHSYSNIGASIVNTDDLLYKNQLIEEIVIIGRHIKGSRYTLRFNYDLFLKLCTYINKFLKYV